MNDTSRSIYILGLDDINKKDLMVAGGKGANLGELSRIEGLSVPPGFCITTKAYQEIIENNEELHAKMALLALLKPEDRKAIHEVSASIRKAIEDIEIPERLKREIAEHLEYLGEHNGYAVRSSATAEDLPTASFAGQQDTYLNIVGKEAIIKHISKCWASLFTERAVMYRLQNGFDHHKTQLAVVVQKMIVPKVSGVMFTADPVSSNRKILSIDASFGLGEALVSGMVNPDTYKVRQGLIIDKKISSKKKAIEIVEEGGTKESEIDQSQQLHQALTDSQIVILEQLGRKIEQHFGCPQDIEWCLAQDVFHIVQSRPITTLFPVPEANDEENHVYVSVGHQQMMTDAMKPLGLSFFLLTTPALMRIAGGRLFVDVTPMLASQDGRENLLNVLGKSDPIIRDALTTIIERGDFVKPLPDIQNKPLLNKSKAPVSRNYQTLADYDPTLVYDLMNRWQIAIEELKQNIQTWSGVELFDFISNDILKLKKLLADPESFGVIMTAMNASTWLNEKMEEWLGEKKVADILSQSVRNNITSEMGLALLDVGDVVRNSPEVMMFLQQNPSDNFLEELDKVDGGKEVHYMLLSFLNKYGMRCAGEIDITRTRWIEKPSILIPLILSNIKNLDPRASKRKVEQGLQDASKKERELLDRLKLLPGGDDKVRETKRMIDLVRNFIGYREFPKYALINHYFIYKKALLKEAGQLVQAGVIYDVEDVYYLTFDEFREVVRTQRVDYAIISERREAYRSYERLTPPRVITSDGEIIVGQYKHGNLPSGAIPGLAVSSGVVEGRARVILRIEDANVEEGDILVTAFTDPSWTPLFVSIKGLVTEVGGLMTHGAVIAREYGLPAVVGVDNATRLIKDGQHIRVNGTEGYVELVHRDE
jgi:pyruvate,water dikinase